MIESLEALLTPLPGALLAITVTVFSYLAALSIYRVTRRSPLANPVLIGMVFVALFLHLTDRDYTAYFAGAQALHFLLGTATVALAVPLFLQLNRVRKNMGLILVAVSAGSLVAACSAMGLAAWLGASEETIISLAPKSVTTPVAMAITERLGGLPALSAVVVILTGILGAIIGPHLLPRLGVRNKLAVGLAIGTASHGVGTARLLQLDRESGAWSGLAMGLNALITAIIVPLLVGLLR
ncbi:LrgB family protein [Luminiphilus syltensis NOR5-1B]|uniref:LrgB family protein n=1 Tax=Luminiphilus syltensis NOR5-1B TaxID=565045 RepID=B8KTS0_9GAMM|nr:LrgB family protein [Luminiphilus syltensis]EED35465.1 LrgB family protein [Luminiphilus syltensis NOR5-1B]